MKKTFRNAVVAGALALLGAGTAGAHQFLHVVREPRLVPMVSSKTEKAWTRCTLCDSRVSYERTYRRDPYQSAWVETTKAVPAYCRSCAEKQKRVEKLRREEANLDRKIAERELKARVAAKRQYLRETAGAR